MRTKSSPKSQSKVQSMVQSRVQALTMAQAAAVSVAQELDKLKTLSAVDQRKAAAILGALVADAASKVPPGMHSM